MKEKRKIKFEVLDPTGVALDKAIEMDYYNLGWETPPEEYPDYGVPGHEPMKKVRYLLTIGEHKYWINREGEILEHLTKKQMDATIIRWFRDEGEVEPYGVLLHADNGDTQYLTKAEYEQFLKNRCQEKK